VVTGVLALAFTSAVYRRIGGSDDATDGETQARLSDYTRGE